MYCRRIANISVDAVYSFYSPRLDADFRLSSGLPAITAGDQGVALMCYVSGLDSRSKENDGVKDYGTLGTTPRALTADVFRSSDCAIDFIVPEGFMFRLRGISKR